MSKTKAEKIPPTLKKFDDEIFQQRLAERYEEVYSLYSAIYHDDKMFNSMIDMIFELYQNRSTKLKDLDKKRLKEPNWYCKNDSIVIQLYAEKFAENLKGIETKLDYLQKLGIKFVYVLPFLRSPPHKSDGGFACSDYRNVREDLGTIEDLEHLINALHERGMCFMMDFIINHTSDEHEWAIRAKRGEIEYQNRYYFYDSWYEPNQFDSYGVMGHFFGDIAPDNFTFVPECQKIVMTTYYPYQWDLNFSNPIVFNQTLNNILFLMNRGVDILVFNANSNMWKKRGTSCRNLPQAYIINQIINLCMEIVCPGGVASFDIKRHKRRTPKQIKEETEDSTTNTTESSDNENDNIKLVIAEEREDDVNILNDESESENEKEYIITESGVIAADAQEMNLTNKKLFHQTDNEEEEDYQNECNDDELDIDFDFSTEIGKVHRNIGWISRLWAALAFGDVHSISYSINAITNRFAGDCYLIEVHKHDDINWGFGFDVENNSFIGNGKGLADGYRGGIITLYRYLNDYYSGSMLGSFSRGIMFAEDMVTGKARICGTTASLLGLEAAAEEEKKVMKKIKKIEKQKKKVEETSLPQRIVIVKRSIQTAIDKILLLHAVAASMPSMFSIYYGDETGKLNDYSYLNIPEISHDTRYLQRGIFNWEKAKLVESDKESYQSRIFNGIKDLINARLKCPFFTDSLKTIFIKNYTYNNYYNEVENDEMYLKPTSGKGVEYEIDNTVLIFKRIRRGGKFLLFIFNFGQYKRQIRIEESHAKGQFRDMIHGNIFKQINNLTIEGYGYLWFEPIDED
ncbi:hypothetical protein M9Y10_019318 [Tritrichomonas musculus]|uniref:Glycosyl hydrolase family 13 catalytic domain-containing protein n=1 Tax=Tritrichomonas musculus TaxID=1915356 RepID=A0ABR2HJ40_9EUKA